jgi:hypothetical protein
MGSVVRFEVAGDAAMACYFLMANWPGIGPTPILDTLTKPMAILVDLESPAVVDAIRATLRRAELLGGEMAPSSRALQDLLEHKAADLERPTGQSPSARRSG